MPMLRTNGVLAVSAALLAVSGIASAGYKHDAPAYVGDGFAGGALGSVRNSPDAVQYVGIQVIDNSWAWFLVTSEHGKQGSCTTTDANLIALARSVSPSSDVHFEWDQSGQCTSVTLRHGSYLAPPVP